MTFCLGAILGGVPKQKIENKIKTDLDTFEEKHEEVENGWVKLAHNPVDETGIVQVNKRHLECVQLQDDVFKC